jgi:CSLREA domain-containing protein
MLIRIYILTIFIFLFISGASAATFTVTKTADTADGVCNADCSLREAMLKANEDTAADTINFNIPGGGVKTILLTSTLPAVKTTLTINGATQPGYLGKPLIELKGVGEVRYGIGLGNVYDASITVIALAINSFGSGIEAECDVTVRCDVTVLASFLGTDRLCTKIQREGIVNRQSSIVNRLKP